MAPDWEEQDAILPDDFDIIDTLPQELNIDNNSSGNESASDGGGESEINQDSDTTSQGEPATTVTTEEEIDYTQFLKTISEKARVNHKPLEVKSIDEVIANLQKGADYDRIRERESKAQERLQALENDASRKFMESRAKGAGLSVEAYIAEIERQDEQSRIDDLVHNQQVPEEIAKEMVENRKFRERYQSDQETKVKAAEEKAKGEAEISAFTTYFQQEHGRLFNADSDKLPEEVWEANRAGMPLQFAYMNHRMKELKSESEQARKSAETAQSRNTKQVSNKAKAVVGSVAHGSTEVASDDPFLKGFGL